MVELYVRLILNGTKTLEDISDENLKEKVRRKLLELGVMSE